MDAAGRTLLENLAEVDADSRERLALGLVDAGSGKGQVELFDTLRVTERTS